MNKKTKWIITVSVLMGVTVFILFKTGIIGKKELIKVTAEKTQLRTIIELVSASGKIYPEVEVKVSPDISGEITELYIQEGDTVIKGQLLARIYADIYSIQRDQANYGVNQSKAQASNSKATLDALQAQLDQAERNFDMQKKLFDDRVISKSEFNVAEANFKTAKANYNAGLEGIRGATATVQSAIANLNRANKDLGRTSIVAPMDGVVSLLNVKKGEKVAGNSFNIGTEMLRIANMDKIEVRVDVGENDIPKVKLGDSAFVSIDAYSDRKFKGIVTQIASSNNGAASLSGISASGNDVTQYKVYVRLLPESYQDLLKKKTFPFRPGMSASADIQTKTQSNVLSVPINAVTTREKKEGAQYEIKSNTEPTNSSLSDDLEVVVFLVDEKGQVKKQPVKTGIQDLNYIEIIDGLKDKQQVVTGPYDVVSKMLNDSITVKIVEKKELFENNK